MEETPQKADTAPLPPQAKRPLQVAMVSLAQAVHAMRGHPRMPEVVHAMVELERVMGLEPDDGEGGES